MTVNYRDLLYHWPANVPQNKAVNVERPALKPPTPESAKPKKRQHDHVELTDRDRRLFNVLNRIRCLGQKQIERLLESYGKGTFRKRLLRLSRAGYLKKLTYGQRGGVYGVAWTGGHRLREQMKPFSARNLFELEHQLGLNEIYLQILLWSPLLEKYIDWQDGYYAPIQLINSKILPDGILRLLPLKKTIYLEFDRGTKKLSRLEEQLRRYRDHLFSPYSERGAEVWFFTETVARSESITKILRKVSFGGLTNAMRVMPRSEVIPTAQLMMQNAGVRLEYKSPEKVLPTLTTANHMIPADIVREFSERAVSMYYECRRPLPTEYRPLAALLYAKK